MGLGSFSVHQARTREPFSRVEKVEAFRKIYSSPLLRTNPARYYLNSNSFTFIVMIRTLKQLYNQCLLSQQISFR